MTPKEAAELYKGLSSAATALISRVYGAIPEDKPELLSIFEQWIETRALALRFPKEDSATTVANTLFDELIAALREHGVNTF